MNMRYASLGQVLTVIRNGLNTAQYDEPFEDDLLPISRIETISDGTIDFARIKYARVSKEEQEKYHLQRGDILFSHINSPAHIGKTAIFRGDSPLIHGVNLLLLRPDHMRCDPEYLNYYLKSYPVRALFQARCKKAVNQASLNQNDVKALRVPLPPLPEQHRIAAVLARADRLRRLRRYALDLGDSYLQSVFLQMFGDLVTNSLDWPVYSLSALSDSITYGVTASASTRSVGPKFLRITDIQDGMVRCEDVPYCAISDKEIRENALQSGDLVFARTGATTGKSYLIRDCPRNSVFASYLIRVRPGQRVDPFFLSGYFQSRAYWSQILETASGSAQPGVNATKLGRLQVPLPPLPSQQQFARVVHKFERLRAQQREAQRQAEHLFQALLHRAFLGELAKT